jgi:hypothetical protein
VHLSTARLRRLEKLERRIAQAPAEHRLAIALKAAGEVFPASGVLPLERDVAAVRVAKRLPTGWEGRPELAEEIADAIAAELATPARRASLRAAVAGLAKDLRDRLPRLSAELDRALSQAPPADDPAADLVWVAAVARSFGRE